MHRWTPTLLAVTLLSGLGAAMAPALAQLSPNAPGTGVPGPLAGAGLPFLLIAGAVGAYRLVRRRQEQARRRSGDIEQG